MTIPESAFNSAHSYESTIVSCTHGQLARQCPLCERDAEIERLRKLAALGERVLQVYKTAEDQTDMHYLIVDNMHSLGFLSQGELTPIAKSLVGISD